MIALWTGGSLETRSPQILRDAGIPIFYSAGLMGRCLASVKRTAVPEGEGTTVPLPKVPVLPHGGALTEGESLAVLEAGGVPVPRWRLCTRTELARTAEEVGYPIVIKTETAETHISDRDAVILGIRGADDLAREATRIAALPGETLLVSRFLPGRELIVSTFHHPQFGLLLMVGSGGQLVELQSDVRFVPLPASRARLATALSDTLVGRALARKFRGAEGFEPAVEFLRCVAAFALAGHDNIAQIELNPVTVGAHGAAAVDASVVARES